MNVVADSDARSWNLRPGDTAVPHCTVRSLLGGGTSYEVYDAVDDRRFTPVVLKMLRPHVLHDTKAVRDLKREIKVLDHLRHPLIVRWLHHDAEGERPYVALEKAPGKAVEDLVSPSAPMPIHRLVDLGMGLAAALHYMRTADVVHLDIVPRNVMMLDRIPRLIDFDLARTSAQAAALRSATGSPRCRAPEQCDPPDRGVPSFATDVWGLGMTLHMAATGEFPFDRGSTEPTDPVERRFPQLTEVAPRLGRDLPSPFADIVAASLAPAAADRPAPSEVYFALQSLSIDGDTSVRTSAPTPAQAASVPDDRQRFQEALRAKQARRGTRTR